uniref:Putative secreted protein n=1 Tax=Ixodes ricinus TaxID=34613 RepID=A0A6B0TX43_IXORI
MGTDIAWGLCCCSRLTVALQCLQLLQVKKKKIRRGSTHEALGPFQFSRAYAEEEGNRFASLSPSLRRSLFSSAFALLRWKE